jgi:hypothetical protein
VNVYTYYIPVPQLPSEDEAALIAIWKHSWMKAGFDPIVLSEKDCKESPYYEQYKKHVKNLPSINPIGYDEACWMRWLAASCQKDPIVLMSDYDVINYGWKYEPRLTDVSKVNLYYHNVPCLAAATPEVFGRMCDSILAAEATIDDQYQGRPNFEDQHWIFREMRRGSKLFKTNLSILEYGSLGWQNSPLVHYCNNSMENLRPRHAHIWNLRSW